ncbi:DNA recombinase [Microbacterium phage Schubert]|uniref:DNA recombinase n=1 Tax=Microbacterium phage Schubert TaxID=2500787 RepID=A0A3Q9RA94_9CAUD|nr:DNA recombinase [Microbacterium phage Schubert]AZV01738.1 DNA recombinase [Microbacterium phage Schubert]
MDTESLRLIRKVWRHSGVDGNVWVPHIAAIGTSNQKFREGAVLDARNPKLPELRDSVDWYWTPAVSSSDSRKAKEYPAQRVIWVDCDESYNDELLQSLKPTFMWETSPGHKQAVWLLKDYLDRSEYHRDGFMGMLTQALGGDKSGVDIGQLLRVPGTWHHKRRPFQGRILRNTNTVFTRGQVLTRVAKGLGFSPGLASDLGADDPYGDRSKIIWKVARSAAELGLPQDLTFKIVKATKWNKWKDEPERLKEDIARAYEQQPEPSVDRERPTEAASGNDQEEEISAWDMATADEFGTVLRTPLNWVVPNIIPEAGCGLLVAAPKVGKTRVAMELALGVATGRRPLGLPVRKKQGVGFFSLEDGEYLFAHRLSSYLDHDRGRGKYHWDGHITRASDGLIWEPPVPMPFLTAFRPIDLSDEADQQRLRETIIRYDLKLVIIDTLSMAIGKADVSQSKDMYAILKELKEIAKSTKCAVMFIHHTRKRVFEKGESIQEKILGSTALHGWSDFILSLADPTEDYPDFLRLAIQTKMGNNQHYLNEQLKIIQKPVEEEDNEHHA